MTALPAPRVALGRLKLKLKARPRRKKPPKRDEAFLMQVIGLGSIGLAALVGGFTQGSPTLIFTGIGSSVCASASFRLWYFGLRFDGIYMVTSILGIAITVAGAPLDLLLI